MIPESDELRRLRSRVQAVAEFLKLPFRKQTWRGQAGEFSGAGVGTSLDFQDHRNYLPGDDPRHINWQAYARTGHYTMKLYREEVRPLVDLVFDVSDSMFFEPEKAARSVELFYFIIECAWRDAASLVCHLVKGKSHLRLSDDILRGEQWAESAAKLEVADPNALPAVADVPFRANAMRVYVSDLLYPTSPEAIVTALSSRKGRGMILAPYARSESDVDWDGNLEFIDAEDGSHHRRRVEPALLKRYLTAYRQHFEYWKTSARRHGVLVARVPAHGSFREAMQHEALAAGAVEMFAT